jgi:hypothetical protein
MDLIKLFGIEYPVLDAVALFLSFMLIFMFREGTVRRAWYLIASTLMMNVTADSLFGYATVRGFYRAGNPLEMFYDFAYILFALGLYEHTRIL